MSKHVWAVQETTLIIAGITIEHGVVPTGYFTMSPEAQFSSSRDSRGNVCRSRMNNPIVPCELTLYNWSRHNQELSVLHAADTVSNKGDGIGVLSLVDNQGTTLVNSDAIWVVQAPTDWTLGEEAFEVTWSLEAVIAPEFMLLGGN